MKHPILRCEILCGYAMYHQVCYKDDKDPVVTREDYNFNLQTRKIILSPDPELVRAYFEERVGTPERLIACVERGEFRVDVVLPLLTDSARAEWESVSQIALAQYRETIKAVHSELDRAVATPNAEYDVATTTTFWTRLWHAVWPLARKRYEIACLAANRRYQEIAGPICEKHNSNNRAAYKTRERALIVAWVDLFTKPENRIESWR